jgi:hypothetical protein
MPGLVSRQFSVRKLLGGCPQRLPDWCILVTNYGALLFTNRGAYLFTSYTDYSKPAAQHQQRSTADDPYTSQ